MPFQYSPEQKLEAFRLMVETMGDVQYVSNQTGISVRTLQYWKSRYRVKVEANPADLPERNDQYFKEQYRHIRNKLFHQVSGIMQTMEHHATIQVIADLTPVLARLIDRLTKMEELIRDTHFSFEITWLNPEELVADEAQVKYLQSLENF